MENFIKNHRKLSISLFVVAVVLFVLFIIFSFATQMDGNSYPIDKDTPTSDSDVGSVIQFDGPLLSISADEKSPEKIAVTAYSGYRNAAVEMIRQFGFDPTDYKITFNYESPFKRYE